ncbi:precorrin-6y C5,15-methyltransferase (decarboxylating) subunit CbiE [uncultured Roseovarius sp.]|uniref:precorrin-6y C5,15-methyltransferase (decarboxylating) subunit CbiE n=1 Tax=uncultured Roseovarius sp. TaxID=293344 RepID=UPI00262FD83C|nr:precorrin-6y C5,15-methyltransferase (decarboxylating) subunit CbiE [uncultured Roseovarius sp.]
MADAPWITIIGLGEDGPQGLSLASHAMLEQAEVVMGPKRHLDLLPDLKADRVEWPVPFSDGIEILRGFKDRQVVVLASGDPFWFGAGTVIAREFNENEWRALPAPSTFAHAASRMGWAIENTLCIGLHAAPLPQLRPHLSPVLRAIILLRDGDAVKALGDYLTEQGFGPSAMTIMEAVGGPRERTIQTTAETLTETFSHPVCVAIEASGTGSALPKSSGLPDDFFMSDGVMTKRPMRALTLSALAPRAGERLWDIGGGSGSVAIEWLLSHQTCTAITIEPREDRRALIRNNANALGVDRLEIVNGTVPNALAGLASPDALFIGGGLTKMLLEKLEVVVAPGTRMVANAVTLEAEALLATWQARKGGDLMRFEMSQAATLGSKRGWKTAYPVVQWSGVL